MQYLDVINFWFEEVNPKQWWQHEPVFDQLVQDRFGDTHSAAICCELYEWRRQPLGRLAEIVVLDQFSRNIYRSSPLAFAYDSMALCLAQEAVVLGADKALEVSRRAFLYVPYMHSESRKIHEQAVTLFSQPGLESNYEFELKHKAIIDRFGRYPHRNKILGRASTAEEEQFLAQSGSGF